MDRILVIEDDPAVRDAFRRILEHAGFEVIVAEDGRVALAEVGSYSFGAIVCDLRMPTINGQGVYAVLHELFPSLASRMIFVTAYRNDPKLREFLTSTGQPVFDKPVDLHELVASVRRIASRPRKDS